LQFDEGFMTVTGQVRCSFLKKRTKKLLYFRGMSEDAAHDDKVIKVFWFFFSKKNTFLSFILRAPAPEAS
jgi:hypothetical protein